MDRAGQLREVIAGGGPAQSAQAQHLLALLDGGAPPVAEQIARLYDAYLNDPYLTR